MGIVSEPTNPLRKMVRILRNCEFQVILKVEAVSSCREVDRRVLTADTDAGLGLVTCGLNGCRSDDQTVHPTAEFRSGLI